MIHPLSGLLSSKQTAVLGPISQPGSQAASLWQRLRSSEPSVLGVDPLAAIDGCVTSLNQLPQAPDVVYVATNDAVQALIDCEYAGVPLVVTNQRAGTMQRSSKVRILQTDDFGYHRPMAPTTPAPSQQIIAGDVAIVAQSGIVASSMLESLAGVNCSFFAAVSPDSDVQLHEILTLLLHDPMTSVVGLYVESVADNRQLLESLRQITPQKPVVLLMPNTAASVANQQLVNFMRQCGVVASYSLAEFSQLMVALAATPSQNHKIITFQDSREPLTTQLNARYASALRQVSGIADEDWLALTDNHPDSQQALNQWRSHTTYAIKPLSLPDHQAAFSQADSVRMALHHATPVNNRWLDAQAKQRIQQQLHLLPSHQLLDFPLISSVLQQADLPIADGIWVGQESQPIEVIERQLGWPMRAFSRKADTAGPRWQAINSRDSLRQLLRNKSDQPLWLQSAPTDGLELHLKAERDPVYGPKLDCALAHRQDQTGFSLLLPLSTNGIEQLLQQLGILQIAPQLPGGTDNLSALRQFLTSFATFFSDLPELSVTDLPSVIVHNGQAVVADARLQWI